MPAQEERAGQPASGHEELRMRGLQLQRAGDEAGAAKIYESVLASWPGDGPVLGNLAVIRFRQGRFRDALRHIHRACELVQWRDPVIGGNFGQIVRGVLRDMGLERQAAQLQRYRGWSPAAGRAAGISILLPEGGAGAGLGRSLHRLAEVGFASWEVLVPELPGTATPIVPTPPSLRRVAGVAAGSASAIQGLAASAAGDWLLVLGAADELPWAFLAGCRAILGEPSGWAYGVPQAGSPAMPRNCARMEETAGFRLLAPDQPVPALSQLLISRRLYRRIGSSQPTGPLPVLDLCLRLLREAEPFRVPCGGGGDAGVGAAAPPLRLPAITAYLDAVAGGAGCRNPLAPAAGNWGMQFYAFLLDCQVPLSPAAVRDMVQAMDAHMAAIEQRPLPAEKGFNLVGFAAAEFGLGENLRALARAARAGGIPYGVLELPYPGATRHEDRSATEGLESCTRRICSIFCVNPDMVPVYQSSLDRLVFQRDDPGIPHRKVGYWFWELERVPPEWAYAFEKVDEIWVASEFVAGAMRAATSRLVVKVPPPVAVALSRPFGRAEFGLPEDRFLFHFSFSFASYPARKNPRGLIRAFRRAFPDSRVPVGLVLKSTNGAQWPEALASLVDEIGGDPRIVLTDGFMSREAVYGLQSVCDCHVSLHRAEGFGLGLAEAMCLGKPVIATAYSGNLEFMNAANSGLVDHALVSVQPGEYALADPAGYRWADPDLEHAAHLMAKVFADGSYRDRIARQGRADMAARFSAPAAAAAMRARLQQIGAL